MKISSLKQKIPPRVYEVLEKKGFEELRPCQIKAINAGLFDRKNLLICTPTASGKTLVAELAALNSIFNEEGKAVYIVPLKSLASEKYKDFKKDYGHFLKIALSIGDSDSADSYLEQYDIIVCTAEKLDSLIRHKVPWLALVKTVIVDEIHLLNDLDRGPTLEILITILKDVLKKVHIIGLSATIGNPEELAEWLDAKLVKDDWRPVKLHKGIYLDGEVEFFD